MSETIENEITYTHESTCEVCGCTLMGEGEPEDYTISAESKDIREIEAPPDHDCEFTEHDTFDDPITETVTYDI